MRRKYRDCQRADGDCSVCSLVSYGRDCHNQPITALEWSRRACGMTQQQLADKAGVGLRLIQKLERGEAQPGNLTARNLLSISDALGVDPRRLI